MLCKCSNTNISFLYAGYVVLQNTQALTPGIVELPYAVLLDAFVPYLSDNQPKVHYVI